jgi:hypothetical protein
MERDGDGLVTRIALDPGQMYRVRYLLDGDRLENDRAAHADVPNEFGGDDPGSRPHRSNTQSRVERKRGRAACNRSSRRRSRRGRQRHPSDSPTVVRMGSGTLSAG